MVNHMPIEQRSLHDATTLTSSLLTLIPDLTHCLHVKDASTSDIEANTPQKALVDKRRNLQGRKRREERLVSKEVILLVDR